MSGKIKLLLAGLAMWVVACTTSGPQAALDRLARALEDNNPSMFLAGIDMQSYARSYLKSFTESNTALGSLNELGNILGLGNLDQLINNIVDVQGRIRNEFERGVASGELVAQCNVAITPDCPWTPESLRNAEIIELGPDAAIARITTPARITSWLAMCKRGQEWQVAGRAVLENNASEIARQAASTATQPVSSNSAKAFDI